MARIRRMCMTNAIRMCMTNATRMGTANATRIGTANATRMGTANATRIGMADATRYGYLTKNDTKKNSRKGDKVWCHVCSVEVPKASMESHCKGRRHIGRLRTRARRVALTAGGEIPLIDRDVNIVYEDECILVCNKPAGLLSVPGLSSLDDLVSRVRSRGGRWSQAEACHRLDMATSGLMVIALTRDARSAIGVQFKVSSDR